MKNTFSKLRRINKALINKLNGANKIVYLQMQEIDRLNKLNADNYNAWLEEHEINRKLSIGLTVSSLIVFAFATAIVWIR